MRRIKTKSVRVLWMETKKITTAAARLEMDAMKANLFLGRVAHLAAIVCRACGSVALVHVTFVALLSDLALSIPTAACGHFTAIRNRTFLSLAAVTAPTITSSALDGAAFVVTALGLRS